MLFEVTDIKRRLPDNEIILYDQHAEILLYDKTNTEKARAIIDLESIPVVSGVRWYLRPDGYVATNNYKGSGYTYLHSVLLGEIGHNNYGDHKDGNRLNNTMCNLRIATPSQNGANKRMRSNNKSGRTGVHWSSQNQKWCAMICFKGKHINLGYFNEFEDAVGQRRNAEQQYFGEYKPDEGRSSNNAK